MNVDTQTERIGFALIRIAAYIRRNDLRKRFEGLAFELIESVARRDLGGFFLTAHAIESLVRIGKAIYEIEPINADMIISEIGNLKSEMRQFAELAVPLREEYGTMPQAQNLWNNEKVVGFRSIEKDLKKYKSLVETGGQKIQEKPNVEKSENERNGNNQSTVQKETSIASDNPAIRQSAITEKIRQSGNKAIQLKEIVAGFPNVSERTIRYDLQRLCSQGVIERIGQGGPGTSYRARVI